jgi:hypothetical protein
MSERIDDVVAMYGENSLIMEIVDFIRAESSRAVLQPKSADDA